MPMKLRVPVTLSAVLLSVQTGCARPADGGSTDRTAARTVDASTASSQAMVQIDSSALLSDLRDLSADSMEGRATGTPGGERAGRFLDAAFAGSGLEPVGGTTFRHPFTLNEGAPGVNFVGRLGGRNADRYIVVSAHYDHLGVRDGSVFNGTDDNASGVAAMLAIARAMRGTTPANSILFVAMDAEEGGLRGARAFVANPPVDAGSIAIDINLDMVSRSDVGELWVAGTHQNPELLPLVETLAGRAPVKLRIGHDVPGTGSNDWTTSSDHGPFHAAGIPFLYFGVEDHEDYHRATDDFEKVDPSFYVRVVRTIADAIQAVDAMIAGVPSGG